MSIDPFEEYARAHPVPEPKTRKAPTPQQEAVAKVREERARLRAVYHVMRQQWIGNVLVLHDPGKKLGPFLAEASLLDIEGADKLMRMVEGAAWLIDGHPDLRFLALAELDRIIIKIRERNGMIPFDDPIEDDTSAFFQIKRLLNL